MSKEGERVLKKGQIVKSVAGHDKAMFYAVVEANEKSVTIADGKARKLAKPKTKNILHVKKTCTVLGAEMLETDKKLRKALASYRDNTEGCEQI